MSIRNLARALLIGAATLARADQLALRIQNRKSRSLGLVVAVHETPVSIESRFRQQLEWVSRYFTISSLQTFAELWEKPLRSQNQRKPPILFTFDDGRESNYTVAAPMLESFGGRGVFFVVPAFAECVDDAAIAFYRSRINPDSKPEEETWEDHKPMSPSQIRELASRGPP